MMKSYTTKNIMCLLGAAFMVWGMAPVKGAVILEGWTDVDTLDFTNVVGAWNFVESDSPIFPASDLVVQGVTFTTVGAGNGTYGSLQVGGLLGATSGFTTSQAITSGGTATDQANLSSIVNTVMNGQQGGAGNDTTLDISGLASGTYLVQYMWSASGAADRSFRITGEGSDLGSIVRTSNSNLNYLIAEQVSVTDGTLNLRLADGGAPDNRRLLSGLIVSEVIPEPSSFLLSAVGVLFMLFCRRR